MVTVWHADTEGACRVDKQAEEEWAREVAEQSHSQAGMQQW